MTARGVEGVSLEFCIVFRSRAAFSRSGSQSHKENKVGCLSLRFCSGMSKA